MEISSFSLQEGYQSTPFFEEFESFFMPTFNNNNNTKKRPYDELYDNVENDSSSPTVQDLWTQFLSFDDNDTFEEKKVHNITFSTNRETQFHLSNSSKKARSDDHHQTMNYNNFTASPVSDESISPSNTNGNGTVSQRRLWVKDRSNAWWEQVNSPDFPEMEFKKAFRMSRATFDMICQELESVITKKNTMLRSAIPVRQRVAVCIWRLATGEALRDVSSRFGLGISTCHKLVLEVCTAIKTVLMPKFLQWPDEQRINAIKKDFENLSGISNVGGSIYTTHIPIIAPKTSVAAYFNKRHTERNQKTSYSTTVQGVVDINGIFTDISVGWPGSMTDDQVLEKSSLFQRANRGALRDVKIVGNSSFPLLDWLLVPYTHHRRLTWKQNSYNKNIEEVVQRVAKSAFMRLKARWSCLQKRTEMKLQDLPVVLGACCVLHNICEMRNEVLCDELKFELFDDEMVPENPVRSIEARNERDQIAHKLLHHNHGGTLVV